MWLKYQDGNTTTTQFSFRKCRIGGRRISLTIAIRKISVTDRQTSTQKKPWRKLVTILEAQANKWRYSALIRSGTAHGSHILVEVSKHAYILTIRTGNITSDALRHNHITCT
ncbi:hypothetical protein D9M68_724020 [compost metagenome]